MTDEQKLEALATDEVRMKRLARHGAKITKVLDRAYRLDGYCEAELMLCIQMATTAFDKNQGGRTCLGAVFHILEDEQMSNTK